MDYKDFFPLNQERYAFVIGFFGEYAASRYFPMAFSRIARGESCAVSDYAGINIPCAEDGELRRGPTIYSGPYPYTGEFETDFHEFAVIMLSAAEYFLAVMRGRGITEYAQAQNCVTNEREVYTEKRFIADIELFRRNFCNVGWIKAHCYGQGRVVDSDGIVTEEYHGREWGECWYEEYGRLLDFGDIESAAAGNCAALP